MAASALLSSATGASQASLVSLRSSASRNRVNVDAFAMTSGLSSRASSLSGLRVAVRPSASQPAARAVRRQALPIAVAEAGVERSYVMIKPDGVQRGLVGDIIARFERKGFTLRGLKLFQCPEDLAKEHYKDLADKPFYSKLVEYIVSGPVVAMVWEGKGVVASARKLIGATNPLAAEPGTIRGDLAVEVGRNVVHGSDSIENGEREIGLWFKEGELCEWEPVSTPWLRE
eukprot:TRINITY_DN21314_c0_g1_i1.p1 TRINITY_DN21314_c0_g1~~TRINITY_DN21314_c0_g1_i1.p1  ORF type:complete len:230 (+),score=12.62 TRINITY_DN21314_c0_g1_i1:70-759(+)